MAPSNVERAGSDAGREWSTAELSPRRWFGDWFAPPEGLFSLLDGRQLVMRGRRWRAEVFSVAVAAGARYVQMALHGDQEYLVTLRILPNAETRHVIPHLLTWLSHPGQNGSVIEVR
jgi:hypothetical protein